MSLEPLIKVDDLSVCYGKSLVLWEVSLQVTPGKIVGIIGPNGAGKSTFLKTLMGICPKLSGKVSFWGKPFTKVRKQIAYLPQREEIDWDFPITVFEAALMGRYTKLKFWQRPRISDKAATLDALKKVGLLDLKDRQIGQLSGGQQQKLFLARAMLQEAKLYLMDELFQGIDATSEKVIMEVLQTWKKQGKTLFIVHHDLSCLESYFDELILLNKRIIAHGPTKEVLTEDNIKATYGKSPLLFEEASRLQMNPLG